MSEVGQIIGEDKRRLEVDDEAQIGAFGNVSYFENPRETVYIDAVNIKVNKIYIDLGSSFILGHPSGGVVGSDILGFTMGGAFILDHNVAGVLDSIKLDSGNPTPIRIVESKIFEDFSEDFSATTYKDVGNTTATWDTSNGSIDFGTGSVAQSLNIGSDIQLDATNIDRVKVSLTGSNWFNTVGSITSDGTNWFGISYGVWKQLDSGSIGSEIMWKITDTSQTAGISQLDVSYKQDDI